MSVAVETSFNTFGLNEHQRMIRSNVLSLLQGVMSREQIRALDKGGEFPERAFKALASAGWMGLPYPEAYGGSAGSYKDLAILAETLGYFYGGIAAAYLVTTVYAGMHLLNSGSDALKEEFVPRIARGDVRLAIAITEPHGGSDVSNIRLSAKRTGDHYTLNGSKTYITNAHVADYIIVVGRTIADAGHKGLSMFLVDAKSPGLTVRPMEMLGRRTTHTNELFLTDVRVPASMMIGEENTAWRSLMKGLNLERLCIAASGAGNCQAIVDYTIDYAKQRIQFGRSISDFQVIQHRIADMKMLTETARLVSYRVADMMDAGENPVMETSMAKVLATENNFTCANLGLQTFGGAGFAMEYDIQMYFRDSRVGMIGGGTNEVQRNIIAKRLGL